MSRTDRTEDAGVHRLRRWDANTERLTGRLRRGDNDGTSGGVEDRVTRLETHMEYVRRDLDGISAKLDTLIDRTRDLPTRADLATFRWQWVATAVAAIALIVGGIIGGLGWIKPDAPAASSAPPVIIQMPAAAARQPDHASR